MGGTNEVVSRTDRFKGIETIAGEVSVITTDAEFDLLEPVWRRITACDSGCTVFQSWDFQRAHWAYRNRDKTLHVVAMRSPGGNISAIAPLYIFHIRKGMHFRVLEFIGSRGADYHDIIASEELPRTNALSLLVNTLQESDADWDIGHFCDIRVRTADILSLLFRTSGIPFIARKSSSATRILLPATYEEYRQSLGKSTRKDMNYDERRLEKTFEVSFDVLQNDDDTLQTALAALQEVNDRRWAHEGKTGPFREEWMKQMDRDIVTSAARNGHLAYFVLNVNGRPVAGLSGFPWHEAIITHTMSVSTEEAFRSYSIGNILLQKSIRWSIEHGYRVFDLTRGSESYKFKYGAVAEPNYEFYFFRGRLPYLAARAAFALNLDKRVAS